MDGGQTGRENGVVLKKNRGRGRPRKYGLLHAPLVASPNPSTPTPQQKRGSLVGSETMQRVFGVDDKENTESVCDRMENMIAKLEHVLYRAKILKDISYMVVLKLIECLADDEEVWSNMGNTFNDELLEQMKARYGPYKTITEENVDEFLDEQFMRTKIEMKDDKGKAKVTADLLDELFISIKKETLQVLDFGTFNIDLEDTLSVSSDDGTNNHRKGRPAEGTSNQRKEADDKQRNARPGGGTSEQRKARPLSITDCVLGLRAKLKEPAPKRGSKCCSSHSKKKN